MNDNGKQANNEAIENLRNSVYRVCCAAKQMLSPSQKLYSAINKKFEPVPTIDPWESADQARAAASKVFPLFVKFRCDASSIFKFLYRAEHMLVVALVQARAVPENPAVKKVDPELLGGIVNLSASYMPDLEWLANEAHDELSPIIDNLELHLTGKPPITNTINKTTLAAAKYIMENPGSIGEAVADAVSVSAEHFRSRIVPELKKAGLIDSDRVGWGYYPAKKL